MDIIIALFGLIEIHADEKNILHIKFTDCIKTEDNPNKIVKNCIKQLEEYFVGKRRMFDLTINLKGTDFQKKVWHELCKIPYGKKVSYKQIAKNINNEKAVRAVGTAIGKNPIAIVVPCHRVISSNGSIGGYAYEIEKKEKLLNLENSLID